MSDILAELIHDTNEHEHQIVRSAMENLIVIDRVAFDDHSPLRDRIERNCEIQIEFKRDYLRFLVKWL
tara:strand:+ start:513 stop:716 length:204 start_codon:yes stop_codon:yes gene_type:complete